MPTLTVTLSDETQAFVDRQVAEGRGSSAEGYVLALVQQDQRRIVLQELKSQLLEGLEGPTVPVDDAFWNSVRNQTLDGRTTRSEGDGHPSGRVGR